MHPKSKTPVSMYSSFYKKIMAALRDLRPYEVQYRILDVNKILQKKLHLHLDNMCVFVQFHKKLIFFVVDV
jgi:hypothetical protein